MKSAGKGREIRPATRQARHPAARHGRGGHHLHGRRGGHPQRPLASPSAASPRWAPSGSASAPTTAARASTEFVPLATLDDLVFGGWDIYPDNAYEAARKAGVLSNEHLAALKPFLETIKPWPAVFDPLREEAHGRKRQEGQEQARPGRAGRGRHRALQEGERPRPPGDGLVRLDRGLPRGGRGALHAREVREGPGREPPRHPALDDLRLRGHQGRHPVRERRAQPLGRLPGPASSSPRRRARPSAARTSRPARR